MALSMVAMSHPKNWWLGLFFWAAKHFLSWKRSSIPVYLVVVTWSVTTVKWGEIMMACAGISTPLPWAKYSLYFRNPNRLPTQICTCRRMYFISYVKSTENWNRYKSQLQMCLKYRVWLITQCGNLRIFLLEFVKTMKKFLKNNFYQLITSILPLT